MSDLKFGDDIHFSDEMSRNLRDGGRRRALFVGRAAHNPEICYFIVEGRLTTNSAHERAILRGPKEAS